MSYRVRIALFSEVYWPMVSGVGVTLLRLTEALRATRPRRAGLFRHLSACPQAGRPARGAPLAQRPALPVSRCPVGLSPAPRRRGGPRRASGPTWSMWPPSSRSASPDSRPPASSAPRHRVGPHRLRPVRRALRRGLGAAGRLALSPLVLRPGPPGALSLPDLRGAPPQPRGHPYRDLEPGSGPGRVPPALPERGLPEPVRRRARAICW